ncbi:MAG: peptidoglycan-associated lipoprotein [Gammaproteobacteria bacterium HGW-Gammaproteobacteria-3]|nr:MAG: peptidoglycan-associated lipoprotein [Gammaproteobacteria bacterium HGW-Gammaproteobacteria-3]
MKFRNAILALAITATMLSGCSSDAEKNTDLLEGSQAGTKDASVSGYSDAGISGTATQGGLDGNYVTGGTNADYPNAGMGPEFSDPSNPLSTSTIYFMYDSSRVKQDFIPVIAAHVQYLLAHPNVRLTLAGHADERGSPEYNIALGEQRAKSVARMMKVQGVSDNQLELVSYGEEKPATEGHDDAAWQLNRRVELLYQGQ